MHHCDSLRRGARVACLLAWAGSCLPGAGAGAAQTPLFDPADGAPRGRFRLADATASAGPGGSLRVDFGTKAAWPSIRFDAAAVGYPTNWSPHAALALTIENPGAEPVTLGVRIDSRAARDAGRQDTAEIPGGRTARLLMPLGAAGPIAGMIGQPPVTGPQRGDVCLKPSPTPFDPAGVAHFQLFVGKPKRKHAILLKRAELLEAGPSARMPFVDRFGQFIGAEWPGKLHDPAEFAGRRSAEAAAMEAPGRLPAYDEFGGWANGPRLDAAGHFQVRKHGGKWWLVDPAGRLFWSSGITGVRSGNPTRVAGRESFFEWFPPEGDPLARFFSGKGRGRGFDFFAANLFRKYGDGFEDAFYEAAGRRLLAWGVNTVANWSDERAWNKKRVPYVVPVHASGARRFVVSERLKAGQPWIKSFPDPFDAGFAAALDKSLASLAPRKDDPWLLGVFIDNELPWCEGAPGSDGFRRVSAAALEQPAAEPVKTALLARLRAAHASVDALNRAFGTRFASWEDAAAPWQLSVAQWRAAEPALAPLDAAVADQYFRQCRDALRRHLPGALYLGCRFHTYNPEAIRSAARFCDVVSFNIYAYSPSERQADEFASEMDFPAIIGEFHFGATDRGMFHTGLRRAADQADRAEKYAAYLAEAAAAPWCVGAHWFQYLDQPLTGRFDGENYNIGFINATDDPYPELAAAARRFHEGMYPRRAGAKTGP